MCFALTTIRHAFGRACLLGVAMFAAVASAIAEVPPTADLPMIFNGSDLAGWKVVGEE